MTGHAVVAVAGIDGSSREQVGVGDEHRPRVAAEHEDLEATDAVADQHDGGGGADAHLVRLVVELADDHRPMLADGPRADEATADTPAAMGSARSPGAKPGTSDVDDRTRWRLPGPPCIRRSMGMIRAR